MDATEIEGAARNAASPATDGSRELRVLLVDDNRMNQVVAAGILARHGHEVEIVSSGAEAVAVCLARPFDVVFMDIMMPEMDGFQATACIRANESLTAQHTPIVGLSARDMPGDRAAALDAGLDDYLAKPIRADHLLKALQRWTHPQVLTSACGEP